MEVLPDGAKKKMPTPALTCAYFYASVPAIAMARGIMFLGYLSIHMYVCTYVWISSECDISRTLSNLV